MSDDPNNPRKELHVTVDSKQMESLIHANDQLQKEKEALEAKVQDSETAQELLDDMREKASTELSALGVETNPEDIKTTSDLNRAVETIKKLRESKGEIHGNSSGSAPLENQYSKDKSEGFGTHEEMIRDLRERASRGDATAKEALRQLMFKALKGMRQVVTEPYKPEPTPTTTSDLSEDLKLSVKPDVCGIQTAYRKKKLMERAEKGDAQALAILNSGNY